MLNSCIGDDMKTWSWDAHEERLDRFLHAMNAWPPRGATRSIRVPATPFRPASWLSCHWKRKRRWSSVARIHDCIFIFPRWLLQTGRPAAGIASVPHYEYQELNRTMARILSWGIYIYTHTAHASNYCKGSLLVKVGNSGLWSLAVIFSKSYKIAIAKL